MREQNMWNRTLMDLVFPRRCPICDVVMAYGEQGICNRHKTLPYDRAGLYEMREGAFGS